MLRRDGMVEGHEIRLKKGDGALTWCELHARAVLNEHGDIELIEGMLQDIDQRKRHEEEMRRLRVLLANIVDSMPSALIGVDKQGVVTHWNKAAQLLTDVAAQDAIGLRLDQAAFEFAEELGLLQSAIQTNAPRTDSKHAVIRHGETRFHDITIYPLADDGIEGAVIRIDDVTERVRMEELMIQSEKMSSVGGLAAGVAHEINNPLAGILQNAQVLRKRFSTSLGANKRAAERCGVSIDAVARYVQERSIPRLLDAIEESGRRAANIVENLLNFSRKSDSTPQPHNLTQLLDKAVELASNEYDLKKRFDFRAIEIVRHYAPDMPDVSCSATQIQQVFLNLLKNGAHALANSWREGDPGPRFDLRLYTEPGVACVEIQDNGPGMDVATSKRILEPFFTTKDVGEGVGLGLSIVYFIIVENHGGQLTVESAPGQGAKFTIRLPLRRHGSGRPVSQL